VNFRLCREVHVLRVVCRARAHTHTHTHTHTRARAYTSIVHNQNVLPCTLTSLHVLSTCCALHTPTPTPTPTCFRSDPHTHRTQHTPSDSLAHSFHPHFTLDLTSVGSTVALRAAMAQNDGVRVVYSEPERQAPTTDRSDESTRGWSLPSANLYTFC
jgi:hypothetical protein